MRLPTAHLQRSCRRATLAAVLLLTAATGRAADFPGPVRCGGRLTVASETVRRGISWSDGRAAVDAELTASTDQGWRASVGVDAPAYPDVGGRAGWTLGAARAWQIDADWSGQASMTHYALAGSRAARETGYTEVGVTGGWRGLVFVSIAVSPDRRSFDVDQRVFRSGKTAAVDVGITRRIVGNLSFDAGLGHATVVAGRRRGYAYGSAGLRLGIGPVRAQLGWVDSQAERRGLAATGRAGARVLASASLVF